MGGQLHYGYAPIPFMRRFVGRMNTLHAVRRVLYVPLSRYLRLLRQCKGRLATTMYINRRNGTGTAMPVLSKLTPVPGGRPVFGLGDKQLTCYDQESGPSGVRSFYLRPVLTLPVVDQSISVATAHWAGNRAT
jgi:hypothetical protein